MAGSDLLTDAFDRIKEVVHEVGDGLDLEVLHRRPGSEANSIAWLLWHLTRIQDDHVAKAADRDQVWMTDGWAARFSLPFDEGATGYGQNAADVSAVRVDSVQLLVDYHDAVHAVTVEWVGGLADSDYDRVVDTRFDPPVTLAVRLVSVVTDDLQHVGQAAYLRGLLEATI